MTSPKKSPTQLQREIDAVLKGSASADDGDRYFIRIKTAPHQQWIVPSGWSWADLEDAKRGARKADALWMAVELVDGVTGKKIRYTDRP